MAGPVTIDYVSSWSARLAGRLFQQFRSKTTWNGWVTLLAQQAQDAENALQSLLLLWDVDNSSGAALDLIGRLVGQPRQGAPDDPTYRLYLKARIAANRSKGGPEDIYKVFVALYGTGVSMVVTTSSLGVKTFALRIKTVLTRTQGTVGTTFLRAAKEAGARALLEWQENPTTALFTYDGTAQQAYDVGVYAAAAQA